MRHDRVVGFTAITVGHVVAGQTLLLAKLVHYLADLLVAIRDRVATTTVTVVARPMAAGDGTPR